MHITLTPQSAFATIDLSVAGSVLTIRGAPVDLATYDSEDPHPQILGVPQFLDGEWHVTVIRPYWGEIAPAVENLTVGDGLVALTA